jgi:hypothetical protein
MLTKQKELHRKLKIVYLINVCDARLETLNNWVRCHNSDFFPIAEFYRDIILSTKQKKESLRNAYMRLEGIN